MSAPAVARVMPMPFFFEFVFSFGSLEKRNNSSLVPSTQYLFGKTCNDISVRSCKRSMDPTDRSTSTVNWAPVTGEGFQFPKVRPRLLRVFASG